ncbi:MAG: M14 family metallopeptidase [Myxococcota bacterium]
MGDHALARLESLARPFRHRYLHHDELTAQLQAWAEAFPHLVRLQSLGESAEGRPLWLLTLGPDPDRARPSAWIDGNMHASELAGSSVALAMAEDVLRAHLAPQASLHGLSPAVLERIRGLRVYVLPRMSPDGAELFLRTGQYVRSNPRDHRPGRPRTRWVLQDVDGDGLVLSMRVRDPQGDHVESREVPGLMVPRELEDEGPFYRVYPEGIVEGFDGDVIPDPAMLSDNETDLNRNFPWSWRPEPHQDGAGAFPTSEPESRAVVGFLVKHPEIFALLNLHTFGGCFIRPLADAPDNRMDAQDLALFRQIEAWGEELTGYPMVSGYEEFLYKPDKPLHGSFSDYAYFERGCVAYVTELWDLFAQIGLPRRKPFIQHYSHFTREDYVRLARWDAQHNAGRAFRPWRTVAHPQLGTVEVGGVDPRVGLVNPSLEALPGVCLGHSAMFLRVMALAPALKLDTRVVEKGEARVVELTVANEGYLPTYILASSRELPFNEPLQVRVESHGVELLSAPTWTQPVGHLEGWGRGRHGAFVVPFHQRSRGNSTRKTLRWTVKGRGTLHIVVGSCRVGTVETRVELG